MELSFLFWLIVILWVLFWGFGTWGGPQGQVVWTRGSWFPVLLLFCILGYAVFGFAIHR